MSETERFYNLLFEASNENRHSIMLLLKKKRLRITDLSRELELNNPETRRHISRLEDVRLITRDIDGFYRLTPYGETALILFRELEFLSHHNEYFSTHMVSELPPKFIQNIGDLSELEPMNNPLDYLRYIENLIKEANDYVWLLVDQFPVYSISSIASAIERGIRIRMIETRERVLNPDFDRLSSEESIAISRTRHTPLTEQRMIDKVIMNMFVSDNKCVLALPEQEGKYDYTGFTGTDEGALDWCRSLFKHYWEKSVKRTQITRSEPSFQLTEQLQSSESIEITGSKDPEIDAKVVQDAVDHYTEVILKGEFNFGVNRVTIRNSVRIKGETNGKTHPSTIIYKKGWNFPFTHYDSIFLIDGRDAEVSIENINFTDFNHTCIWIKKGKRVIIRNNSISLISGYGRGMTYGAFGDVIIGIWAQDSDIDNFSGNLVIEDNYIDFARGGAYGGFLTRGGLEKDPEYRPDLVNHEYFMSFGLGLHRLEGKITLQNNTIKNINARGIATTDNLATAEISIINNIIESDTYGSYPFYAPEAGCGILVQSAWGFPSPGFHVDIVSNTISFDRVNYSGIKTLGPTMDRKGADKLLKGVIKNNNILLAKGYEGIHVRRCDEFKVLNNKITGNAYYGIRVSGRKNETQNLMAQGNIIMNNNMDELRIQEPDAYSDNHADGNMFQKSSKGSRTSNVWLGKNTYKNIVEIRKKETLIDEGEQNQAKKID